MWLGDVVGGESVNMVGLGRATEVKTSQEWPDQFILEKNWAGVSKGNFFRFLGTSECLSV